MMNDQQISTVSMSLNVWNLPLCGLSRWNCEPPRSGLQGQAQLQLMWNGLLKMSNIATVPTCPNLEASVAYLDCLKEWISVNAWKMHVNMCEYYIWWLSNSLIDADNRGLSPDAGAVVSGESDGRSNAAPSLSGAGWGDWTVMNWRHQDTSRSLALYRYKKKALRFTEFIAMSIANQDLDSDRRNIDQVKN